jgi:transcriptional regulator with XRE-family HTH domain
LLGWSQDDLAERSGISKPTIGRLESQDGETLGGRQETGEALVAALEKAGIEFIAENGGGAGVRLKKRAKRPSVLS